jgi:16S rRNA (adenine1518-N6/adenine1519-N6)-dimethyltransferase
MWIPGMGVLTKYLNKPVTTYVIEIDTESVTYLDDIQNWNLSQRFLINFTLIKFLREAVRHHWEFPYNISTQIVLEH